MIRGTIPESGEPIIRARVELPEVLLQGVPVSGEVDFLLATGADNSTIEGEDAAKLGVPRGTGNTSSSNGYWQRTDVPYRATP